MAIGVGMYGYRSAREMGSDGSEMIRETYRKSCFGLTDIQHLATLGDNDIDQIPEVQVNEEVIL